MLRTARLLDKLKERDKVVYMDDEPAGIICGLYHTGRYTARNRLHDTTSGTGEIHSSTIFRKE